MDYSSEQSLRQRLEEQAAPILGNLQEPNLEGMRAFVCLLDDCLGELGQARQWPEGVAGAMRFIVLQSGFPALAWCLRGELQAAASWMARIWQSHAAAFGLIEDAPAPPVPVAATLRVDEHDPEYLAVYNLAVAELMAARFRDAQVRLTLRRLMAYLGLSPEELGRLVAVSGDTVRAWERGRSAVPDDLFTELVLADASLSRMLELIRPDRLAQVVRRKADLFDGEQALDWILRGQMAQVAERYDAALAYQA